VTEAYCAPLHHATLLERKNVHKIPACEGTVFEQTYHSSAGSVPTVVVRADEHLANINFFGIIFRRFPALGVRNPAAVGA
jgi:hypothetical protein